MDQIPQVNVVVLTRHVTTVTSVPTLVVTSRYLDKYYSVDPYF
jgi:hypothetical protein